MAGVKTFKWKCKRGLGEMTYSFSDYLYFMEDLKICIFLTGTISPSREVINLVHTDTKKRESEYYAAICDWILLDYQIVFCENSDYESKKLEALFANYPNCEYLKFHSSANSKSEGEAEIFKYSFSNSKTLREAQYIVKSTGRYTIKNTNTIIKKILENSTSFSNDVWCDLSRNLTFSDSRFFVFKPSFYQNYLEKYLQFINENNDIFFETCLARSVHSCLADGKKWALLPEPIICKGIYGTEGIEFKNDYFRILKRKLFLFVKKMTFNL